MGEIMPTWWCAWQASPTPRDWTALVMEARAANFPPQGFVLGGSDVAHASAACGEADLRVVGIVDHPHGAMKPVMKSIEATGMAKDGAHAIWVVPHLPHLLASEPRELGFELREVVSAVRSVNSAIDVGAMLPMHWIARQADALRVLGQCNRAAITTGCDLLIADFGFSRTLEQVKQGANLLADQAGLLPVVVTGKPGMAMDGDAGFVSGWAFHVPNEAS